MKLTLIFVLFSSLAFGSEVSTDCPAMNHSREKIVKIPSAKRVKTSSRVISQ